MRHLRLPTLITRADIPTAVFGGWDGCISVLAVMVGLAASGHLAGAVAAGMAGAVGGTFSMASGQYVSMPSGAPGRVRESAVMGLATGLGGLIPVVPFLLSSAPRYRWPWTIAACVLALVAATVVATVKAWVERRPLTWRDAGVDYLLLAATAAATYAVGAALS